MTDPRIKMRVARPQPSASWEFDWALGPLPHITTDNRQHVTVTAGYAADQRTEYEKRDDDIDPAVIPNSLHVKFEGSGASGSSCHTRLSREAAEMLVKALTDALDWDGT